MNVLRRLSWNSSAQTHLGGHLVRGWTQRCHPHSHQGITEVTPLSLWGVTQIKSWTSSSSPAYVDEALPPPEMFVALLNKRCLPVIDVRDVLYSYFLALSYHNSTVSYQFQNS